MLHKIKQLRTPLGWRWLLHSVYTKIYVGIRKLIKIAQIRRRGIPLRLTHIILPSVGNAGDTALSTAVRNIFERNLGPVSWQIHGATEKVTDRLIKKFNRTNAIVIGGHGMFLPDTNANDVSNWEFACA